PNPFPLSAMVVLFIGSKCLVLEAGVSNARRSTRGEQRLQLAEGPSAGRRGAWRGVSAGPDEKLRREDRHRRHHFARGIPFQDVAVCAALRSDVRISTAVQIPQIIRPIASRPRSSKKNSESAITAIQRMAAHIAQSTR